jgi:hypothetical protein
VAGNKRRARRVNKPIARRTPEELSTEFLRCRSDRHDWEHQHTLVLSAEMPGTFRKAQGSKRALRERYFECGRCGGQRWQLVYKGDVIGRRSNLPKGYVFVGQGRQHPSNFRAELVEREVAGSRRRSAA